MILTRLLGSLARRAARRSRAVRLRALITGGAADRALPHLRAAHADSPLANDLLESFVRILIQRGELEEALVVARDSARAHPRSRESWLSLGLVQQAGHRYGEALESYDKVLAFGERDADLYANRGIALQSLGRLPDALADYARALEARPGHPVARFHASLIALMKGDYAGGWPEYETRLASGELPVRPRRYPRWDGSDPAGRTLLVYGEQGLGDEIMFASCLPDLERAGARCILECHSALHGLFARSFPNATVYPAAPDKRVPDRIDHMGIDLEVPLGSLPLYFRRRAADFPAHDGYLRADPDRVGEWRTRLRAMGPGFKVGISWKGGTHASRTALRSIPLEDWLPILRVPGAHFVSLQYTPDAPDALDALAKGHGIRVAHWAEAIADYDETAALVSALDLTITVCTSIVHLAGALGRPVWVMAPTTPEWRYRDAGETMPWYPTARVYRQRSGGDWSDVVGRVAAQLRNETPDGASAADLNNDGLAKLRAGDFHGAQACFERALQSAPQLAEAHCNLGLALVEQGSAEAGERELRHAIALEPKLLAARENLAVLLSRRFDYGAAAKAWDDVLARDPAHAEAHAAKAFAAMREGLVDDACDWLARAVELGADRHSELALHQALRALRKGDFAAGWPLYESRLQGKLETAARPYPFPEWDGKPLPEGALLILGEQGLGDEIMFASCYAEAIERAGRCILECEPRLQTLFARSFPRARVVGHPRGGAHEGLATSREIVRQVHAGSLPGFFRPRRDAFPGHRGYLQADASRVNEWRAQLSGGSDKRLIGIAWSGGLRQTGRVRRSIPASAFAELLRIPGAEFVSLQHDDDSRTAAELATRSGANVHTFPEALADIDDTAALMKALDCVVSVCSTVVHLAGALGVPALVLTPEHAEWRYLEEGETLPWYPSVRLVRQRENGSWAGVIEEARRLATAPPAPVAATTRS